MKKAVTFAMKVRTSGCADGSSTRWRWFVQIHPNQKAMLRYLDETDDKVEAMATTDAKRAHKKIDCRVTRRNGFIGELNFYYPAISPGTVAHEFLHAVCDTMAFLKLGKLVPSREYVSAKKTVRLFKNKSSALRWAARANRRSNHESRQQEIGAYMMTYFMSQFHDFCIEKKLWNK